jgi:hypothetical protein
MKPPSFCHSQIKYSMAQTHQMTRSGSQTKPIEEVFSALDDQIGLQKQRAHEIMQRRLASRSNLAGSHFLWRQHYGSSNPMSTNCFLNTIWGALGWREPEAVGMVVWNPKLLCHSCSQDVPPPQSCKHTLQLRPKAQEILQD